MDRLCIAISLCVLGQQKIKIKMKKVKSTPFWKFLFSILFVIGVMVITDQLNEGTVIKETMLMLGIIVGFIIVVSGFVYLMKKFFS